MLNDTGFCGSTFWNSSLTWYTTEEPDLTRCFEKTILVLIPILYLWIFLPLEYYWLRKSLNKDVPWNWKNITKFLLISMICILNLCDFFSNISNNNNNIVKVDIYMPILKLITFISAGILLYYNKKSGIQTSGHQFLFWFLCAFCGAAQFRTEIRNFQNDKIENMFTYWIYLIYYPLVLLMLLMNFIPDDPPRINIYDRLENPTPIPGTIYLGKIFYTYFDSLLFRGFKRPVTFKDMWDLEHESESRNIIPEFEKQFQKSLAANREKFLKMQKKDANKIKIRPDNVKTIYILFKCLYPRFIFGALCKSSVDFIIYVNPQILGLLIAFVNSNEPQWKGFVYAGLMFAVGTVQSLLHNIHFINLGYFGLRARTALICSIYKKALRISNATRKDKTAGEIVNLMAVDGERFAEFSFLLPLLWSTPTQITLGIYFLWQEVGIASLAGVAVLIFLIPINVYIVRKTRTLQYQQMREKDERIKVMNEILNGIKVLKLYAWELSFEKLVQSIRMKEIKTLLKAAYLHAVSQFVWNCAPFLVAFVTFLMYVLIDENNVLDASKAFVSLALINLLRAPMNQIPLVFNSIVQTLVSFKRIDSFMNAEELEPYVEHDDEAEDPLVILNGTFSWGDDSPSSSVLKNINLTSSQNSITAIVGPVGSGKSSLMSALLGEMHKKSGKVNVNGTLAYVPQQAWIQNCSVRENIVFGKSFDKIKYNKVISACALEPDLKMLADGDSTEIGENGINLSGGQKQRISLARAVYDDADIYLLDDPLSAVDSHVGKHIFTHLIGPNGLLSGKVRVLVTHAVTYLPKTDRIFVLKDGKIQESGTYKELLSNRGAFADFLMQHIGEEVSDEEELDEIEKQIAATPLAKELKTKISRQRSQLSESSSCIENINLTRTESMRSLRSVHSYQLASVESWKNISEKKLQENFEGILSLQEEKFKTDAIKGRGKLIDAEKTEKGLVKLAVFKYYFSAVGFLRISGTFLFYIGFQGFLLGSSIWLGQWAEDTNITDKNGRVNTGLRDMYIYVYGALGLAQGICIFSANILFARGATGAATKLHKSLINSVLRLPMAFFDVTPIGRILARFSSDIISVDMRLPGEVNNILSHSLKILGTFVIICYTTPLFTLVLIPILILYVFIQRYFITTTRQIKRLESVSKSPIYTHFSETISGTVVIRAYKCEQEFIEEFERRIDGNQKCRYAAVFANRWLGVRLETIGNLIVLTSALFAVLNKNVNASMVGLSISYSLQITQTLSMLVRAMSDCEASVVSVERIKEYSEVKQEKPWTIPKNKPQQFWPDNGNVKFNDFSVRYRTGLDLVLHGVNFSVNGGEKIGIVGRTGAGKSSLTLSLFRIIEGSAGKIYIDDVDISELGLHDLRSKLTIIPQDAVLFSGTLRLNLDPFESYSDEEVWRSVELAHLKKFVSSLPEGLYHRVSEGGVNLSIGQRQLICLARALLRKTKILILDEATAAVDLETDDLIQKTIREEFHDCTIITIAHRLNTIMDSNRVLVLDRGQIAEFDTPKVLLSNRRSIFYGMCKDAGLAN